MIYLIDNWAIDAGPSCYTVGEFRAYKNKKTGEQSMKFAAVGYYTSLTSAIGGARKHLRMETLAKFDGTIDGAINELRKLDDRLQECLALAGLDGSSA